MTDSMLECFIIESRENIEDAGQVFLELEQKPDDDVLLNTLFCSIHTIKGSSGFFDIPQLTRLVHAAEDVLSSVRNGDVVLTSSHVDLFLTTMDQVSFWLDELESTGTLKSGDTEYKKLITQFHEILGKEGCKSEEQPANHDTEDDSSSGFKIFSENNESVGGGKTSEGSSNLPSGTVCEDEGFLTKRWCECIPPEIKNKLVSSLSKQDIKSEAGTKILAVDYTPDEKSFFSGFDPLSIVQSVPGLIFFDVRINNNIPKVENLNVYDCFMSFRIVVESASDGVAECFRQIFDQVEIKEMNCAVLGVETREGQPSKELPDYVLKAASMVLMAQLKILSMPGSEELKITRLKSSEVVLRNLFLAASISLDDLNSAVEQSYQEESVACFVAFLENLINDRHPKKENISPIDDVKEIEEIIDSKNEQIQDLEKTLKKEEVSSEKKKDSRKVLKVDQERIDVLMNVVGEIVVAKNSLPFLAKKAEDKYGIKELAKEIEMQYAIINRLSEELQSTIMQIRMVPVSSVFQKFPRLVRDLSRKLDKKIKLNLVGEETEADKNVIENLADPLVHLVRNSLDHGLEQKDERLKAGKNEEGTITLRASPKDDMVMLEVIDDGRGMDPNVIKQKAFEKGVIDQKRLDEISDKESLQLIFAPGFSTAATVSDISGRGVGMDVVWTAVADAGGSAVVDSEVGVGTTIRLLLPLSMAISRVMMVEVRKQIFGISMENIVETVKVKKGDLKKVKNREVIVLRDRIIPLFCLKKLLCFGETDGTENNNTFEQGQEQLNHEHDLGEEVVVLVMRLENKDVGIIIDKFLEGIDIVQKPMEGVMVNYPYYSGSALLGDGRVLLILNMMELISCQ